jgi:biotin operon repressor
MKKDWEVKLVQMAANDAERGKISKEMDLTMEALAKRIERLKRKWGCKSVAALVAIFFRNNLIK